MEKYLTIDVAKRTFEALIAKVNESQEPVLITGKQANAVLLAEDHWRGIQETLYLMSIPSMRESIKAGMAEPVNKCSRGQEG